MRQIIKSISFSLLFCLVTIGSAFTQQTEKKSVNLGLQYFKLSTGKQYLKVSANVRINKKLLPVADTEVGVYTMEASASGKLGNIITNVDGEGEFVLPNGFRLHSDSTPAMTFIAVINEDHLLESTETQITVSEVELTVKFIDEDSIKWVNVMVSQPDTASGSIPVSDEEIKFFVNRPFGELPIGGDFNFTNEDGQVSVVFPNDLPGDSTGQVEVIAKIQESELYGNVETSELINWGIITAINPDIEKRSLWASGANAPISLIVLTTSLIIAVWGIIFYIVYKLYKLRST